MSAKCAVWPSSDFSCDSMSQSTVLLYTLMVLCSVVQDAVASPLPVYDGVRVEITYTEREGGLLGWEINGTLLLQQNKEMFRSDGIEIKEQLQNGEFVSTLCIDIELKHQNYTLECKYGLVTLYHTTLRVHAKLPPPENVNIHLTSSGIKFELSPSSLDVDPDNENVVIDVYPNIIHYTVYITNLNTAQEMVYEITDNSTEFILTGLPGEDMNECAEYVFEVAANNARAGEGERSKPQHVFITSDCSNTVKLSTSTYTPAPTTVYPPTDTHAENNRTLIIIIVAALQVKVWSVGAQGAVLGSLIVIVSFILILMLCRQCKVRHSSEIVLQSNQVYDVAKQQQQSGRAVQMEPCSAYGVHRDGDTDPEYETVS